MFVCCRRPLTNTNASSESAGVCASVNAVVALSPTKLLVPTLFMIPVVPPPPTFASLNATYAESTVFCISDIVAAESVPAVVLACTYAESISVARYVSGTLICTYEESTSCITAAESIFPLNAVTEANDRFPLPSVLIT